MNTIRINFIYAIILLQFLPFFLKAQEFTEGRLYINVANESGIPSFVDLGDSILVEMDNPNLESYFNQYGVYDFERSFPIVDSFPNVYKYDLEKLYTLKCSGDQEQLLSLIQANNDGLYNYIEQIPIESPTHTPNDYHLLDPILGVNWALDLINAEQAWDYTHGDPNIKIGICEMGFLATHPDLINKITMINAANTPMLHGTAVAGCAGAETNNGIGTSSIGYDCSLLGYNVQPVYMDYYQGLMALADAGAKIVNASFANLSYTESYQRVIYLLRDYGTLVVAGAGNGSAGGLSPNSYRYPASYDGVISVTSVYQNDSHEGPNGAIHTHNDKVDVCAPGYDVITTTFDNQYQPIYYYATGTSFASPIVAGMAGLVYSIIPDAPPALVEAIVEMTCDNIDNVNPSYAGLLGNGRINAYLAAQKAWNISTTSSQPIVISNGQNITFEGYDGIKVIEDYIKVSTGGTLTIRSRLFFKEGAKIMVEPGGLLIIDGGLLTTYDNSYLWEGIELWGNVSQNQFTTGAQAKIELLNDARIEFAKIAIGTFRQVNPFLSVASGGIIMAQNATFYNNKVSILMKPYENHHPVSGEIFSNLSYFENIEFNNTKYFYENFGNDAFVKLYGVRGISFEGCEFENLFGVSYTENWTTDLGTGIYSSNSNFTVDQICLTSQIPCNEYKSSKFNSLYYGIYAINSLTDKTFDVRNSEFGFLNYSSIPNSEGVLLGIYASGFDNIDISNNTFELPISFTTESYGIYFENCSDYLVTNNSLSLLNGVQIPSGIDNLSHGIIVNNSGTDNNEIYRNTMNGLGVGIQPQNENRGPRTATGLHLKCNEFLYCLYDIAVLIDEQVTNNGIASIQGTSNDPAGNLFTESVDNEYHIYNEGDPVTYYFHNNPTVYPVEPVNNSPNITTSMGYVPYSPTTSCQDIFGGGSSESSEEILAEYEQVSSDLNFLDQSYNQLLDDGNTSLLEGQVESTVISTAEQTQSELLAISPYVSETVLKTAIDNEDAIDNNLLKEILVENPHAAKSEELLYGLLNRQQPMPRNLMSEILMGRFTLSEMEALLCNVSKMSIKKGKLLTILMNEYLENSIDSIRIILEEEGSLASVYKLVMLSLEESDYSQGIALMNGIPASFELSNKEAKEYEDYLSLISILFKNGQFSVQPDSLQQIELGVFMEETSGRPAAIARNILVSSGAINYKEPILKPDPFKSSGFPYDQFPMVTLDKSTGINIFPNPASNSINIEYPVKNTEDNLILKISCLNGTTIKDICLDSSDGHTIMDITVLHPGIYICKIICNEKIILTKKLVIIN